jgi:hypothetical protein
MRRKRPEDDGVEERVFLEKGVAQFLSPRLEPLEFVYEAGKRAAAPSVAADDSRISVSSI